MYSADCSKALEPTEGMPAVRETTSSSSTTADDVPITTVSQQPTSSVTDSGVLATAPSSYGMYINRCTCYQMTIFKVINCLSKPFMFAYFTYVASHK